MFDPNDRKSHIDGHVAIVQRFRWNGLLVYNGLINITHPTGVSRYDLNIGEERQVMRGEMLCRLLLCDTTGRKKAIRYS